MTVKEVLLGFEVGTAGPVFLKPGHLIATGITQRSGKTTTLEGLIKRSGFKAIAFKTKPGEAGFSVGRIIPPFFVEHSNWQYVESLMGAVMGQKMRFERSWIIRACRGAQTLEDVDRNIVNLMKKSRETSLDYGVYTSLHAYFEIVLPQLKDSQLSKDLTLYEGVNIMDLEKYSDELQSLVIRSVVEWVLRNERNTVVIIPEAWKFVPEGRNSPAKMGVELLIRQGAARGNFVWIDSMPSYEVLLTKIDGLIRPMTFEGLFNFVGLSYEVSDKHDVAEVRVHDIKVLDSDGHRLRWFPLRKVFRHKYNGEILSINTLDGVIDVSPNHPVMKYPRYMAEAKDLAVGDRLQSRLVGKKWQIHNNSELFVGTADLAWLLGFYCAEGWVHNGHVCLSNKSRERLEKASKIISENFHHHASFIAPRKGVHTLDLKSPRLADYFQRNCYGSSTRFDSTTKAVPTTVLNAPSEIKAAFSRGYLEGDGSFTRGRWSAISTSRQLMLGIIELLNAVNGRINFATHIREDKPNVVQIILSKGHRKQRDAVKKILRKQYSGYLYDIEVDSPGHTFYMGIGTIRVHNSQDLAGVDKGLLKQVTSWILGLQLERNEVEHTLDQIPLPNSMKPSADKIMTLKVGHFFVCTPDFTKQVYVMPSWLDEEVAKKVAKGEIAVEQVMDRKVVKIKDFDFTHEATIVAMRADMNRTVKQLAQAQKDKETAQDRVRSLQSDLERIRGVRGVSLEKYDRVKVALRDVTAKYNTVLQMLKKVAKMTEVNELVEELPSEVSRAPVKIVMPLAGDPVVSSSANLEIQPGVWTGKAAGTIPLEKNMLVQSLQPMPRKIYDALLQYSGGLTKPQIGQVTGYHYTSGSFSNSMSKLRTLGLIAKEGEIYSVRG